FNQPAAETLDQRTVAQALDQQRLGTMLSGCFGAGGEEVMCLTELSLPQGGDALTGTHQCEQLGMAVSAGGPSTFGQRLLRHGGEVHRDSWVAGEPRADRLKDRLGQ